MYGWAAFGGSAGGAAGGGLLGMFSAKQQNDMAVGNMREQQRWEADQSAKQMAFQERMSNTSHQRGVADLRAAGLNPLLALNEGASTPSGASGSSSVAPVVPELGAGLSSALGAIRSQADLKLLREHTRDAKSKADLTELERDYAKVNPSAYFSAKQGVLNTVGSRAAGVIKNSASAVKEGWRSQSFPNVIELLSGPGYISDKDARSGDRKRLMEKRERRRESGNY